MYSKSRKTLKYELDNIKKEMFVLADRVDKLGADYSSIEPNNRKNKRKKDNLYARLVKAKDRHASLIETGRKIAMELDRLDDEYAR